MRNCNLLLFLPKRQLECREAISQCNGEDGGDGGGGSDGGDGAHSPTQNQNNKCTRLNEKIYCFEC